MAELRIGTATSEPAAGTLKVGSTDIQEIYLGANKIWPSAPLCTGAEEVQIGNLIWKTANTESLSGSSGDIIYYASISPLEAQRVLAEEIPVATLYNGDSNNQQYGRYYNKYAARDIIPPTGFRLARDADFENLNSELQQLFNEDENGVTSIGGGEINRWATAVQDNYYFGRSCFNSRGVGYWRQDGSSRGGNTGGIYWTQEQADLSGNTNQLIRFDQGVGGSRIKKITGIVSNGTFAPIRFCKDASAPGEVQIGNLIWTDVNTSTLDRSGGGTIPIVTNNSEAISAYNTSAPAAAYWEFDPANSVRGLYYNMHVAAVITPPAGFRLPTESDYRNLRDEVVFPGSNIYTSIGGGTTNFWNSTIQNDFRFGTSGFNAIAAGWAFLGTTRLNWISGSSTWWDSTRTQQEKTPSYGQQTTFISGGSTNSNTKKYTTIRFCKDA